MRILIDARLYGLENAGLGRYTINLVGELAKIDEKNDYVVLLRKKYFENLKLPKNWKKVLVDFRHYTLAEQIKLPPIIKKENPDLVHFLHFNAPIFYKGKFIVTIHDLLMQSHRGAKATTLPAYIYYPKQIGAKYVFKKTVHSALRLIVPSRAVKKEVVEYYHLDSDRVVVTYEGVDPRLSDAEQTGDKILRKYKLSKPYFIYTGNAYPHKNLERAICAIVHLNKSGKNVIFTVTSSRDLFTQRLENLIKQFKAENHVKLLGFVPDLDLSTLYKNSVAFLFPSLSEGFGLPGLEAMAAGTLVLASDIPVFREVYKDVPIYFDPYSVELIEKSMEKVIKMKPSERARIITKGKKLAEKYSWSKMAQETLKIYNRIC